MALRRACGCAARYGAATIMVPALTATEADIVTNTTEGSVFRHTPFFILVLL